MKAYHNDPALKQWALDKIRKHREADKLVQGIYWKNGKGCAVGCIIESDDHAEYEAKLGIPQMLARLEDCIFEGLPNEQAMEWPERFLDSIPVGADLSLVGWKFLYWLLTEELEIPDSDDPNIQNIIKNCRSSIKECSELLFPLTEGKTLEMNIYAGVDAANAAEDAADAAAYIASTTSATRAVRAARSAAYTISYADYAAVAAARATANAAAEADAAEVIRAVACAVRATACAAVAAVRAAYTAAEADAARENYFQRMADKLIELLKNGAQ